MLKLPVRVPDVVGEKTTETVQPVLEFRETPQVTAASLKSPVTEGVFKPTTALPVFEIVMFCAALVELITVEANARVIGFRTTAAAGVAVPASAAVA
jgi:hypothetical protein